MGPMPQKKLTLDDLKEYAKDKPELLAALAYLESHPQAVQDLEQCLEQYLRWLESQRTSMPMPAMSMPMTPRMPMSYPTTSMAAPMSYPTTSMAAPMSYPP